MSGVLFFSRVLKIMVGLTIDNTIKCNKLLDNEIVWGCIA